MSAAKKADPAKAGIASEGSPADTLAALLFDRAPPEDLAAYDHDALNRAAELVRAALKRHRKGDSIVSVERDPDISREGRRISVITVVNDNMPFLFDSVMGEITERVGEPFLVTHPVFSVTHGKTGVMMIADGGARGEEADKVSVIHVHVPQLSAERAEALEASLTGILAQVRVAVSDWRPMLARLDQAIASFRYSETSLKKDLVDEAIAFLEWLRDDNFTFLGMREYHYAGNEKTGRLERMDRPGLGLLADPNMLVLRSGKEAVTTTPEIRAFMHGPDPLIVTKANAKSQVHRRIYLDYIGVKTFDAKGKLAGELRIVGMFTSTAYTRSVLNIPYLRSKAKAVISRSGFDPADHSGKALINVLESYPRDELFQIDVPLLRKHAAAILALGERPRVRALVRHDRFDRFVSVIVFVPRDRYDSRAREAIGDYLKDAFDGRVSAFYPAFPEGTLARVHFIIGRSGGKTPKVEPATIEAAVRDIVRTWEDALAESAETTGADAQLAGIAARFPESYRGSFSAGVALHDAGNVAAVTPERPIVIDYYRDTGQRDDQASLKIYHFGAPVALSRRVPLLEDMGFRVISERTFEVDDEAGRLVFIHDMELESGYGRPIDLDDGGKLFDEIFLSVWNGDADSDGYNALGQTAQLGERDIAVLRAYGRFLQQVGIPQSQDVVAAALSRYPQIARALAGLFAARFDPAAAAEGEVMARHLKSAIHDALADVPSIDDDTIIRRYVTLIEATLRTNHYAKRCLDGEVSRAFKLDSRSIDWLPQPRPWREIFVYGPEVEGVHLRYGPIARGGLRWSDRGQDYRTEVLGLVKAQQVKNAVIVPVGAKGGFYPKRLPVGGSRDAVFEAGRNAYVNFVSSMLSVTDNLIDGKVVPPEGVVRRDDDDPYFVVAADKGTATFSDTANAISQAQDFWLDDAFASGGSAGYDHKKMGITARGGWEAVKRHFREMDRDIQSEPFTCVGVGDMSGDVFGNGMLLSRQTRLIAAFDHRDIFIDPEPDAEASFAERQRLFNLPRSSWQDFDPKVISKGGGVFSRSQKSITLSAEAAAAIGFDKTTAAPAEILSAILKAPVDLVWFGGIGTYVRASNESNQDVGDRANDPIRVAGAEIRAKVIGEGANLGVTQRGRIEYGLNGGRCNSDAIDNSAGVNSSDVEVNIKIALTPALRSKRLTRPQRDKLLAAMTDEVARLVLANNYRQTLAISLAESRGAADLSHQQRLMATLEASGLLDRKVEFLPSDAAIAERAARGQHLTRPEIAVLLAYAKMALKDQLIESALLDEAHLAADLLDYFPDKIEKDFRDQIDGHRLRREIIATQLANDAIDRGGPSFVSRLRDLTGAAADEVVDAFVLVRDGFGLPAIYAEIDALDAKVGGMTQIDLYQGVGRLVHQQTAWHLKLGDRSQTLGERIAALREARKALEAKLEKLLPAEMRAARDARRGELAEVGVPEALAKRIAWLDDAYLVPESAHVARLAGAELPRAAQAVLGVSAAFRIGRIEDASRAIAQDDYFDGLAVSRAYDMIGSARRGIAVAALTQFGEEADPVEAWVEAGGDRIARARERLQSLTESGELSVSRLTVAAGLMTDLAGL